MGALVTSTRYALRGVSAVSARVVQRGREPVLRGEDVAAGVRRAPRGSTRPRVRIRRSSAVGVTEALARGDDVADHLLDLLDGGEAPAVVAGPEHGRADAHLEDAAGAGHERDRADLRP